MNRPIRVLIIEDSEDDALLLVNELKNGGLDPVFTRVESLQGLKNALTKDDWDCVISDYSMPHFTGLAALAEVQSRSNEIPFILVSGAIGEDLAVTAMKWGAHDYIMKGNLGRLVPAIERELKEAGVRREAKRTNEALKEIEQRFRKSFVYAPIGMALVGLDGRWLQVNSALCQIVGYSEEELLGMTFQKITHPDDLEADLEHVRQMVSGEIQSFHMEKRYKHKQGNYIWVDLSVSLVRDPQDRPSYFISQIHDIDERRRAEEAIRDSEERFRMVFEHVFDGISIYSEDPDPSKRKLIECNDQYAVMAGRSREELLLRGSTLGLQKTLDDMANDNRLESLTRGTAYCGSYSWIRPDGKENIIEYVGMPITWRGKAYSIGIDRDVTERKRAEETQLLLTTALESTANGVVITDLTGNIVWVNKAFTMMTGYDRMEIVGQNPKILKSGKQDDSLYKKLWKTISAGNVWQGELINKKKDGSLFAEDMTITPLKKANGEITHFIAVKQDITERKEGERELRLMAQTVASARDCISITDLDHRFLFVNDSFRVLYGYTSEELLGRDATILRSPQTPAATTDRIFRDTLDGGWHGEIVNRRKDGSDFPIELWTSVVKDDARTPVAIVGVARDITDRRLAEQNLRQSEEQFRLIAENVVDMIAVLDLNGRRIYNSPSYNSILGDPASLKGTDGFREIHPEDKERIKEVFQETVRTGVGQRLEYRLLGKDGSTRNIESKGSVIRDRDGQISRVVVVSRDVTEEKKLAAQFLRAQRMESIGTLAGGIAHDLNNVLAPIMMAIDVLKSKIPDPAGQKILDTIATSAKRGSDIVKQVLAFGRGVKGERIPVQLRHVVNEVVKIAGETFPKSIEVKTDIPRDLWTVSADPTQMHQVLLNLLVNARDAMPKGGALTISAANVKLDENYSRMHPEAKPGVYASIAITDTGTGIPTDIQEKIFEPFFTTKEIGRGTGLGLSTTLAILKSHQGFINLYSEEGKGTSFRIYIPATGTASNIAAASEEADLPMGNGEWLLIIDDEAAVREITRETLQAHGYRTLTANDGAEGVAVFAENKKKIKIVITDIMMPVMDGTAAILALQKISPTVKIIAASGLTPKGQVQTPESTNVKAFLTKPYTAETLLKALAAALEE